MKARFGGPLASENSRFRLVVVPFLKSNHVIRRGFGILPDVFDDCARLIGIIDERSGANVEVLVVIAKPAKARE